MVHKAGARSIKFVPGPIIDWGTFSFSTLLIGFPTPTVHNLPFEMPIKPISSCEGRIERLLITLPPLSDISVHHYYSEIEEAFEDREMVIKFSNYVPSHQNNRFNSGVWNGESGLDEELQAVIKSREILTIHGKPGFHREFLGEMVDALKAGTPITHSEWVQDPFCILSDEMGRSVFLQPLFSRRYMDKFISLQLAARVELDMLIKPTELIIEGGNVLAGEGFVLVGKDTLAQNVLHRLKQGKRNVADQNLVDEVTKDFELAFGERVMWVGFDNAQWDWKNPAVQTYQPAFHLDLFVTLGGRNWEGQNLVFVGDPGLGIELLRKTIPRERLSIHKRAVANFKRQWGYWEKLRRFEDVLGTRFKVVPIPLYIHQDYPMTFSNGLIETTDGMKVAYLPDYEVTEKEDSYEQLNPIFRILKSETESIFIENGFNKVNWIGPGKFFRRLSLMRGSLHCITKVLKRSQ